MDSGYPNSAKKDFLNDIAKQGIAEIIKNPKTVIVFAIISVGSWAIVNGLVRVSTDYLHSAFRQQHSQIYDALEKSNRDPRYTPPYSLEQRAIAVKMIKCATARDDLLTTEGQCAGRLIADAAIYGGEERAKSIKTNLVSLGFEVPNWF